MRGFHPEVLGTGSVLLLLGIMGVIFGGPQVPVDSGNATLWWYPSVEFLYDHWTLIFGGLAVLGLVGVGAGIVAIRQQSR